MFRRYRVVHYLNQFFAGFGGENHASLEPVSIPGPAGPGRLLQDALGEEAEIVLTVACGDDRYSADPDAAAQELMKFIQPGRPDLFIAGPAFNAGRYGEACGHIGREVGRTLGIPAVSGMADENPGLAYRKDVYIVPTSESTRGMNAALGGISRLGLKLVHGEVSRRGEPAEFFPEGFEKTSGPNGLARSGPWTCCWQRSRAVRTTRNSSFQSSIAFLRRPPSKILQRLGLPS